MRIGALELGLRPVVLAPMEDVTDSGFRQLCRRMGADMVYTEFISADGLLRAPDRLRPKIEFAPEERPIAIQLFGDDPEAMAEAARFAESFDPDVIDINFGCPVTKIVCQGAGAAVLRDLPRMQAIARAVVRATSKPVTVKTRLGWDENSIRILEVARMLQDVGVQALTVHARTRHQFHQGPARWDWLRRLKEDPGIQIPIIGNGDVCTPEDARRMFEETGVDGVMIGRAAIGNPWIFRDVKYYLQTGGLPPPPTFAERLALCAEHLRLSARVKGERRAVLEMRKHYGNYFKGFPSARRIRQRLMEPDTLEGVLEVLAALESMEEVPLA